MINKTINGWNISESTEGMTFEHVCTWNMMPINKVNEKLNGWIVKGIFEDNGSLILAMVKDGISKLLKITVDQNGNQEVRTMDVSSAEFRLIYKYYYDSEESRQ